MRRILAALALCIFCSHLALAGFPGSGRRYAGGGAPPSWGTPTSVGTGGGTGSAGATVAIGSVTVPAGALIVVAVDEASSAAGSVSDSVSNTYTLITSISGTASIQLFYAKNASALSSQTITYTKNTSGNAAVVSAFYVTGANASAPLDSGVTNTATGFSATATVVSGSPAGSSEFFVGLTGYGPSSTATQASGWASPPVAVTNSGSSFGIIAGNLINAGTGTETYNPTFSGSVVWGSIVVAFKH